MHIDMPVEFFDVVVRIAFLVATTFLFGIVLLTYLRVRTNKMGLVTVGFAIAWVHSLITIPEFFIDVYDVALDENLHLLLFLIALIFILAGILKD